MHALALALPSPRLLQISNFAPSKIPIPSTAAGAMAGAGADFHLPDEILAVIPTDPYDQLDLARKITSMAIASRVSKLELENGRLAKRLADKDRAIADLEDRLAEADARLRDALDENTKLSSERDAMAATIKKLGRDLAKLEAFKRQLMQSLNDESSPVETVDIGTIDQSGAKSLTIEGLNGNTTSSYSGGSVTDATQDTSKQKFSLTPYISPRLTPTATPKVTSTSGSPRGYSTVVSPRSVSGTTSPTKSHLENRSTLPSWYPPSAKSSAATSPPHGRPVAGRPRIDGKEFFRQARSRLSYEQFGAFLANIKELNAHKQSREETLRKAEEIFGSDNKDLYLSFQGLLNRNLS